MAVTVAVNKRTVVHKGSDGTSIATPDVCLTQVGPAVVPIAYTNIAKSSDLENGALTVTADGHPMGHEKSFFKTSTGDEAGGHKGVSSGTIQGKAEFISFSNNVFVEGKAVVRAFDQMIHNNKNTPPTILMQKPLDVSIMDETPVIPEQGKVTVRFFDPYGEPLQGIELGMDIGGEEKTISTMSQGQAIHISKKETSDLTIKHDGLHFIPKDERQDNT